MSAEQPETTIILVRHGETEWNAGDRFQGQQDSPLSALGRSQAQRAAGRLAGLPVAAVYSSDLGRARAVADAIAARHGLAVRARADLRERDYGVLEGKTLAAAAQTEGEWLVAWRKDPQRCAPPGGETQPEMRARVMRALGEIAAAHPGEIVVVVTHGGPIKSAVLDVLGAPLERWRRTFVANGSLTVLRGRPELLRLVSFNDTCHLEGEAE